MLQLTGLVPVAPGQELPVGRAEIIAMKKRRRLLLGDLLSIVFENAATMRFQIQEMARAEKMLRDEQIAHELDTYNQLLPETGELGATMFIEIDDSDSRIV